MSEPKPLDNEPPRRYQWILDDKAAVPIRVDRPGSQLIVQVDGLEPGKILNLRGGLTNSASHILAVVRNDGIEVLPPAYFIYPEGPAGTTVTFLGVQ